MAFVRRFDSSRTRRRRRGDSRRRPGGSTLGLLVVLVATLLFWQSKPASAAPVLGGELFATGNDVQVQVMPASAGFTSELWLFEPLASRRRIATNRDVGLVVDLGTFPQGTELVFGIHVINTGDDFRMGPGSRNADGQIHAQVDFLEAGKAQVGFEDLFGGGDRDYNDNVFEFRGGIVPEQPKGPDGRRRSGPAGHRRRRGHPRRHWLDRSRQPQPHVSLDAGRRLRPTDHALVGDQRDALVPDGGRRCLPLHADRQRRHRNRYRRGAGHGRQRAAGHRRRPTRRTRAAWPSSPPVHRPRFPRHVRRGHRLERRDARSPADRQRGQRLGKRVGFARVRPHRPVRGDRDRHRRRRRPGHEPHIDRGRDSRARTVGEQLRSRRVDGIDQRQDHGLRPDPHE